MEGAPSIPASNEYCNCPKSGVWLTAAAAKRRLKDIMKKSKRRRNPQRVYQCSEGMFHLTSQPLKKGKA